jgi:hypothetical protein
VISYLVRAAGPAAPTQQHAAWLDRVVRPALATARKGGLVLAQEQLEFVIELADLNPEFALGAVILDMLQVVQKTLDGPCPAPARRMRGFGDLLCLDAAATPHADCLLVHAATRRGVRAAGWPASLLFEPPTPPLRALIAASGHA